MSYDGTDRDDDNSLRERRTSAKSGSSGPSPAVIGLLIVIAIAIIFVVQNSNEVKTEFLFFDYTTKFWLTIVLAILIGIGLDRLFSIWWRRRKTRRNDVL